MYFCREKEQKDVGLNLLLKSISGIFFYIFIKKKSNLHYQIITKNSISILQLQNWITKVIQLPKLDKFGPENDFKGDFLFCEN